MIIEHLFISDVHIGAFDEATEQKIESDLLSLIQYAIERKSKIYILGDLFDYWMEFPNSDYRPQIGNSILEAFKEYNESVCPALFVTGNHDNWTLGYFEECGFDVETDYRVIDLFKKRFCLMHGDGLFESNQTLKRPLLHRILRHKLFLLCYQGLLPKSLALKLMRNFSNSTRKLDRSNSNPLNNNAKSIIESGFADVVLSGHDHIPRLETFNSGLYINLGTFFHHRTLVRGIDGVLSLVQWDAQLQQFNEYLSIT